MTTHDHEGVDDQPDLHQRVIRQLTRVAFELSAASNLATDGVSDRIDAAVYVLDDVIKDLRRATFETVAAQRPPDDHPATSPADVGRRPLP